MDNIVLFILLALLAEILGTIGGFGSSVFFVPIASLFLEKHGVDFVISHWYLFDLRRPFFLNKPSL